MTEKIKCYVGTAPCGCIVAGTIADKDPRFLPSLADSVADMIREGLEVSLVSGPIMLSGHTCGKNA